MKSIPFAFAAALAASALFAGCAKPKPPEPAQFKASVLSYARQYPANPAEVPAEKQQLVLGTFRRAVEGDSQALARIFSDYETFGSATDDAWCKVPWDLLNAVGDHRFATFLTNQPAQVQSEAFRWLVGPFGASKEELQKQFPETARLYNGTPH